MKNHALAARTQSQPGLLDNTILQSLPGLRQFPVRAHDSFNSFNLFNLFHSLVAARPRCWTCWFFLALAWGTAFGQAQPAMQVFTLDGLRRVRPQDAPLASSSVSIKAARNEYEPFQVVVRAGSNGLKGVSMELTDLRGARGHAVSRRQIALYREHYIQVTKASPKSKEGAGWYPDALIPFLNPIDGRPVSQARFLAVPFDVAPGFNQPVWVEVFVPGDTPAGQYSGTLKVTAQGREAVTVPVQLTVWDFRLPDVPAMRSNFGGFGGRLAKAHHLEDSSPDFRPLERRYAEALAAHRLCPPIPGYLMPHARPDGSIDASETHAALKEWVQTFHVTGLPLSLVGGEPLGKDRERNFKHLQALHTYLKTNGWDKLSYIYVLDEPNDAAAYEEVRQRARLIHQAQPGLKVLCTEQPTPQEAAWGTLVGSVDIWVPLWTLFEPQAAAQRLAAGEELWSYTALCQGETGKDTPYWEMDFPLLDFRLPAWMSYRYGLTGLLYWTTVYWEKVGDVWTNPATYGEGPVVFNGEGSLFYPGADAGFAGPVVSMRLKQIREGLEDYEYLNLLARRGDKVFADDCARRLAASWTQWNENPDALYAVREEMARRLSGGQGSGP